jgi:hypothetical protein
MCDTRSIVIDEIMDQASRMIFVGCGSRANEREKVDCSMKCTSKLIYMRDMNVHVSV